MKKITLLSIFLLLSGLCGMVYGQNRTSTIQASAPARFGFNYQNSNFGNNFSRAVSCDGVIADYTNSLGTGNGGPSQDFEAGNNAFDSAMADDFVMPLGVNTICKIDISGTGTGLPTNPANNVVLRIYNDAAGLPGSLVFTESFLGSNVDLDGDGSFSLSPTGLPSLTGGATYWVSVVAQMDFTNGGQWFWSTASDGHDNPFAFQNPGDGFGTGCTGWASGCAVAGGTGPDLLMNISFNAVSGGPISVCGTGNPQPIPAVGTGNSACNDPSISIASVSATGNIGTASGDYTLDSVEINLTHTWDSDLDITLISPTGTTLDLSSDNGGSGDNYTNTIFMDGSPSITTGAPPYTGTFQAEGGTFAATFAGEPINGNWTLSICDDSGGDSGTLLSYCINFSEIIGGVGNPPVITCPADIVINNTAGTCGGVANFAGIAIDDEDGNISGSIIATPASGSVFAVGNTTVELSVTDSDGNNASCEFTVTVIDNEAPVAVCQDITVDLDPVTGLATITGADVDNGSTDNCSIASYALGIASAPTSGGLSTLYTGGNGGSNGGAVYFDLTVGPNDIDVTSIDVNTGEAGSITLNVYTLVGTYVGNTTSPAPWGAAVATGTGTGAGANNPSNVTLASSLTLSAGTTYGVALVLDAAHAWDYTNGNGSNQNYSNADLSLALGSTSNVPFTAPTFTPRIFNGGINYSVAAGTVPFSGVFDCSNVGPNTISLIVTDASGNSSTCTSTVTVQDVTAPVITCIGSPGIVTGTASTSPAVAIPDNNPAGIATTLTVTDDFDITDLNVNLDITHTWVGDIIVTLESPAGTTAILVDRMGTTTGGVGCSSNDLLITLDDQAATAIEDECQPGPPAASGSFTPNNPLSIFNGESSMGDWILTVSDNAGGDTGTLNSWGLEYSYDVSATPLDVFLDANGMASVNPNDLIQSVDEACGYTVTAGGAGGGTMGSLTTLFATNNGGSSGWAVMYDVTVGPADIEVTELDINANATSAFTVDLYVLTGTYVGNELNPSAWGAPAASGSGTGAGTDLPSNVVLGTPVMLLANTTYGFAVVTTGVGQSYTNGDGTNQNYANGDLSIALGSAVTGLFTGSIFTPRIWNGAIHYITGGGGGGLDFTCADLGENQVEVTVTDDSGNVSTCIATVNVIDLIAPVITCGSEPTVSETVSDSPNLAIPDNTPSGVTSTLTITDDVSIDDLNVNLDVSHTWVGDIIVIITSPAGTAVTIVDRIGGTGGGVGCSGDDILATLDDAAALPIETQCGGGVPSINGTFSPNNPLSAFNGESTLGDWTITISDNAGGDTGTLNSWGITYSYANTNTDIVIELGPDGTATIDPYDIINNVVEACGIATAAADISEVSCADIGTTLIITAFVSDTSGNIASCSATVTVVDLLAPVITCPADQTVDPGAGNLFYIVPDYFATGEATAVDNCTDPVTLLTQSPAPGTALPEGPHTITMTATDEYGNVSTCSFVLTVQTVLGVGSNNLDSGLALFPNPAGNVVNLLNKTNISLEKMMIYDINGKLVSQTDLRTMQGEKAVDVSSLAAGVYVVQIIGDNASTVKRLIKE